MFSNTFDSLEKFLYIAFFFIISFFIFVGFELTILGQVLVLSISTLILLYFFKSNEEKKTLFLTMFAFIIIGNLLYFIYNFIDFSYIKSLFSFFNSLSFFR